MSIFNDVGKLKDFKNGKKKKITVQGHEILIAMVEGKLYAVDNLCTHLEGNLSKGKLKSTIIECPLHGTQFDLQDGKVVRWLKGYGSLSRVDEEFKKSRALKTYDVKVDGEIVSIEV
ncbi:Rieske (2Fe-2S) protein [Chloroflexota bacterium]